MSTLEALYAWAHTLLAYTTILCCENTVKGGGGGGGGGGGVAPSPLHPFGGNVEPKTPTQAHTTHKTDILKVKHCSAVSPPSPEPSIWPSSTTIKTWFYNYWTFSPNCHRLRPPLWTALTTTNRYYWINTLL